MIKAVRGTRDLLPPDTALWNFVEAAARDVFRAYNFQEIRTPIVEDLQLFQRSVGEETDIVSKEMFTIEDRARAESEKNQTLALRPVDRPQDQQAIGESRDERPQCDLVHPVAQDYDGEQHGNHGIQ